MRYEKHFTDVTGDDVRVTVGDCEGARPHIRVTDRTTWNGRTVCAELTPADARRLARALKRAANVAEGKPAKAPKVRTVTDVDGDSWVRQADGTYTCVYSDGEESESYRGYSRQDIAREFGIREEG